MRGEVQWQVLTQVKRLKIKFFLFLILQDWGVEDEFERAGGHVACQSSLPDDR
jgi:hypothetical protein